MHPFDAAVNWTLYAMEPGALCLNFCFRGSVRTLSDGIPGHFNRCIENSGGRPGFGIF